MSKLLKEEELLRLLDAMHQFCMTENWDDETEQAYQQIKALIQNQPEAGRDWLPTSENINSLPDSIRKYIHDIETNCDPAGMIRENTLLKDAVKNQPEVDEEFIKKWASNLEWKDRDELMRNELIEEMLQEAGIRIKED